MPPGSAQKVQAMNEELAFLTAIHDKPNDEATRLVYADWLEERGDPRGEFIRIECELATLPPEDQRRAQLTARAKELAKGFELSWLAIVSRPVLERGSVRFEFECPKKWENLTPTGGDLIRFCNACRQNVHYCASIDEALGHALRGQCVAIDLRVERKEGDLELAPVYRATLGLILIDPEPHRPRETEREGEPRDHREGRRRGRRRR
jgi:uncharacterized protein (TIGR02996 family)